MSPHPYRPLLAALALAAVLTTGCQRSKESAASDPAAEESAAAATPTPKPEPLPAGRHTLAASPPATAADLDRLLNVGFTPEEVLAEVERRGVLRRPDAGERAHILTLPRGERLLDAMEAPANLLSANALILYARFPAGAPDSARYQAGQNGLVNSYAAHGQQMAEYQQRSTALTQRITQLKQRRTAMQQRGEMTATITMEIDRLEREAAALVPPA